MCQISPCLLKTCQAVSTRGGTHAEPRHLRKDEPDPVAAFAAGTQFLQCRVINAPLGLHEALKIERVTDHTARPPGSNRQSAAATTTGCRGVPACQARKAQRRHFHHETPLPGTPTSAARFVLPG